MERGTALTAELLISWVLLLASGTLHRLLPTRRARLRSGDDSAGAWGGSNQRTGACGSAYLCSSVISTSAFSSQYVIPISRYIVVAVARCSWACSRLSVRRYSLPRPRWQWATRGACRARRPAPWRDRSGDMQRRRLDQRPRPPLLVSRALLPHRLVRSHPRQGPAPFRPQPGATFKAIASQRLFPRSRYSRLSASRRQGGRARRTPRPGSASPHRHH